MEEMPEEDFIKLYNIYLELHPGREFGSDMCLVVENGKLVSPNPELTKETIDKFIRHVFKTAPLMEDILKLIDY